VPSMAIAAAKDRTRELRRTLYRAAKADPRRRFHAIYDKSTAGTSWSGRGGRCADQLTASQRAPEVDLSADALLRLDEIWPRRRSAPGLRLVTYGSTITSTNR
jgi:hypothetical protein